MENIHYRKSPLSDRCVRHVSHNIKEARETKYWLRLLIATEENLQQRLLPLLNESNELISILVAIVRNTKINS